jgi:hypothetical protein
MASTTFQDYNQNNPIVSSWLNDVNSGTYTPAGTVRAALQSTAAWVRFSVTGGVVAIQQSSNISTVVRTGTGVYVITYGTPLTNSTNCYGVLMSQAGFAFESAEAVGSVTITTHDTTNTAVDPASVSVQIFGAN